MDANDARVERLRRVNRYKAVQAELALQREEEQFQISRKKKLDAAARDEALAKELANEQRLELLDEKMLQLARTLPELRNLEDQLKHAATKQGWKDQLEEIRLRNEKTLEEERKYIAYLKEQERLKNEKDEANRKKERESFQRHQKAQLGLIEERKRMAKLEAENVRKERMAVDVVVARVREKDFLDQLEKREKQRRLQTEQEEFFRLREALKEADKQRELKEQAAIEAYIAQQERVKETKQKLMREREAAKARIFELQCENITKERMKREEHENLLIDYYEAQRLAKEQDEIRERKEMQAKLEYSIRNENLELIRANEKAREAEKAEEIKLRQQLIEELAKENKLQRVARERQTELRREQQLEAQRALDERRERKLNEKRQEALIDEREKMSQDKFQEYVRRARAMLLAEYIPRLGEFVPAHMLTVEEKKEYGIIK